jgi:hypothetical protein
MVKQIFKLIFISALAASAGAAPIPDVVRLDADAYAQSLTEAPKLPSGHSVRDEYAIWFFQGLTHPSGGIQTESALRRDAYNHGQSWWRDHPLERDAMFAAYGYRVVKQDGIWSRGFERSAFQPDGGDAESWWMDSFGGVTWQSVGLAPPMSNPAMHVHIVGYLSPKGHYGHLGGYEHEVLVTGGSLAVDRSN